jgi:hypothetical protein
MSPRVKHILFLVGIAVLAIVVDKKTGGKISALIGKVPVIGPKLVG